jgi:MFS family permease
VYAEKFISKGIPSNMGADWIGKLFLTGFLAQAVLGPHLGRLCDTRGRKLGTLLFCLLYTLGALSTLSAAIPLLFLGRIASGLGTSLLFSAPESWLVGEAENLKDDNHKTELEKTFTLAYSGDAIIAIAAGAIAATAEASLGVTGPFQLSAVTLGLAAVGVSLLWTENRGATTSSSSSPKSTIWAAVKTILADKKIFLTGAIQGLYEAAMYIFILQWPPAMAAAIKSFYGATVSIPYGLIFSCFMASCLLGSTIFGKAIHANSAAKVSSMLVTLAFLSMSVATYSTSLTTPPLALLVTSLFLFEATVGCYFPTIGTLRSKFVPSSQRSIILNIFGVPLNLLVVAVFLGIKHLGVTGALSVSSACLAVASILAWELNRVDKSIDSAFQAV